MRDVDTERAVLAGIIRWPECADKHLFRLEESDFSDDAHKALLEGVKRLHSAGSVDPLSLPGVVKNFDGYGGTMWLSNLMLGAKTQAHFAARVEKVRSLGRLRRFASQLATVHSAAAANVERVDEFITESTSSLLAVLDGSVSSEAERIDAVAGGLLHEIAGRVQSPARTGLGTGIGVLDRILNGFHGCNHYVLGARTGVGKTAAAMQWAVRASAHVPVLFFSLEMGSRQLAARLIAPMVGVSIGKIQWGRPGAGEFDRISTVVNGLTGNLWVQSQARISVNEMRAQCMRLARKTGPLGMVVVDYLQLAEPADRRATREQQVASISRGLKAIAMDFDVPVISLAQLNRNSDSRQDKTPILSDLRESDAVVQDADVVMFVFRSEMDYANPVEFEPAKIIVAKNRFGPPGVAECVFHASGCCFVNAEGSG